VTVTDAAASAAATFTTRRKGKGMRGQRRLTTEKVGMLAKMKHSTQPLHGEMFRRPQYSKSGLRELSLVPPPVLRNLARTARICHFHA
jgi:hypothetical protein